MPRRGADCYEILECDLTVGGINQGRLYYRRANLGRRTRFAPGKPPFSAGVDDRKCAFLAGARSLCAVMQSGASEHGAEKRPE